MSYLTERIFEVKPFKLELHPFLAAPDKFSELFEESTAIQYGADFKISVNIVGKNRLGIIQLIKPRTKLFTHTKIDSWNVDKREKGESKIELENCLYGTDQTIIGLHSEYYRGQKLRDFIDGQCSIIDTPREICSNCFDKNDGAFKGYTETWFANYIVELNGAKSFVYNNGVVWGYSFVQTIQNKLKFNADIIEPQVSKLKDKHEHIKALSLFLGISEKEVKKMINS